MRVQIGKGIEFDVDTSKLNATVTEHVMYMGLRNILMDSHANHTKDADGDEYVALSRQTAQQKLNALYNGEVRVAGTRSSDPVTAEALQIATNRIKDAIRAKGKKQADYDVKALAKALLEKNPGLLEEAKERVAALKAQKIDMSGIEL